ncbi:hypothetical protein Cst_c02730 [Thermoclostridium stercorarium subsp. stercorarium DSM 8532]|uniref:Uncharacterized protein n=1 Tax=Thermoclostridium stercorarium (strain ATCC 35414 / DSM 8532 / NCIMB 11754) TaxID=1121335 RepID=L7VKL8_THES1|nr:hypothetical protein Cst_c02730 [Thermoclostridium stercorarium subsp. stercorarium DSM 8532]
MVFSSQNETENAIIFLFDVLDMNCNIGSFYGKIFPVSCFDN